MMKDWLNWTLRCARRILLVFAFAVSCTMAENYTDPDGPRYSGDYINDLPTPTGQLRVVTYNLELAEGVEQAIRALDDGELAGADIVFMQEMDAPAVDAIARALSLAYVYYPGSVGKDGDDFGNAVLSRWHLDNDEKLILPHFDPYNHRQRIAVLATADVGGKEVHGASVHNSIFTLGLGARLDQAEAVLGALDLRGGIRLVGGDYNNSDPDSLDQTVARGYDWLSRGAGSTADTELGPMPLDHVFGRGVEAIDTGVYQGDAASDHKPLWVEVSM
jgi:endonuclease/exonuclease/phosphatase family metal-dependent hydrolase